MNNKVAKYICQLYQQTDGSRISQSERERLNICNSDFTYGEINPFTFADILAVAEPQKDDVFYDLGSGVGKAVCSAALLYEWKKCCGIELLTGLHEAGTALLGSLSNNKCPIELINADFLNVDFSDANVIFLHATTYGPMILDPLMIKLHALKSGTRIIINTKKLHPDYFDKISEDFREMGWGESMVFTYKKK